MREAELLARIRSIFDAHVPKRDLIVDNGDDGAIFAPGGKEVIVAADVAVEGVHFKREWSTGFDIGRKITAANLADICAMGGWPEYLLVTAVIPEHWLVDAISIAEGIAAEARLVNAAVIGGDLSSGKELSISITAIGYAERKLLRSGAQEGDFVVLSHIPGWSAAGLSLLQSHIGERDPIQLRAISAHKSPTIPYEKYRKSFPYLSSAIDISDGLVIDAGHIAQASGVAFDLDSSSLADEELSTIGEARNWILGGGEDHVLLGTSRQPMQCEGFATIGRVTAGSGEVRIDGKEVGNRGFQHEWKS